MATDLNTVTLSGNLIGDPEQFTMRNGKDGISFMLMSHRRYPANDGSQTVENNKVQCVAYGKLVQIVRDTLHKGDLAMVFGRLHATTNPAEEQNPHHDRVRIVAEKVYFLRPSATSPFHHDESKLNMAQ